LRNHSGVAGSGLQAGRGDTLSYLLDCSTLDQQAGATLPCPQVLIEDSIGVYRRNGIDPDQQPPERILREIRRSKAAMK